MTLLSTTWLVIFQLRILKTGTYLLVPASCFSTYFVMSLQLWQSYNFIAFIALNLESKVYFFQCPTRHRMNVGFASVWTGTKSKDFYLFLLIQSLMHEEQNRLPQLLHSLGSLTTHWQIRQSKIYPWRLGNLSLSYPEVAIFVDLSILFNKICNLKYLFVRKISKIKFVDSNIC